jgi:hypothetical protein
METYYMLKTGLALHITGIVMMVGFTLATLVAYLQFWRYFKNGQNNLSPILSFVSRAKALQMIGGLLTITGGIIMMVAFHGTIMHMLWFKIKMSVLVLIILNAIVTGRIAKKIKFSLAPDQLDTQVGHYTTRDMKWKLTLSYSFQLAFFLIIFVLSAFKFN